MASFSYGAVKDGGVSRYFMLEPYQGNGYYPIDHFEAVDVYPEPKTVNGNQVYGMLTYSAPLSMDQMDSYLLLEAEDQPVQAPVQPSAVQEQVTPPVMEVNHLVLSDVPKKFVYPTKNPNYMVLSVQSRQSDSGYGNIVLPASSFEVNADGSYQVDLGRSDMYRNVSVKKNGQYEQIRQDVKELHQNYLEQQSVHRMNHGDQQSSVTSAYLNYVDERFFYPTRNPDYKIVSVPYSESENGFLKVTVPEARISLTKNKSGVPVPGKFSVNLGDPDGTLGCTVKQNGEFTKIYLKASEVSAIHLEKRLSYLNQKKTELSAEDALVGPEIMPVDEDDMVYA